MTETQPKKVGFFGKFKRGAIITSACMVVCGVASVLLVPFVPLVAAVAIGGVGGGALASATGKK